MNRWLDSHQATSSPTTATPPRGWASWACTNGAITLSASSGPISVRTASTEASSALATVPEPIIPSLSPSAEPTATVDGTSVSTAKNAISAAWPVVRCALAARPARMATDQTLSSFTLTSGTCTDSPGACEYRAPRRAVSAHDRLDRHRPPGTGHRHAVVPVADGVLLTDPDDRDRPQARAGLLRDPDAQPALAHPRQRPEVAVELA